MGPVLALETPEGKTEYVPAGKTARALGEKKAPLVFVSACRTAETIESFVRGLIRSGVQNVLGWDGSVYDADAMMFARSLYRELAEYASVPYAAAISRRDLLKEHQNDREKYTHWHLARVYIGQRGGGPLCASGKPKRKLRKEAGFKEFLDKANKKVPVATALEFVGRRRQAQKILSIFRGNEKPGVLIHGMGNIGKSSLAARIANRLPNHRTAVVFERYDALAIFDRLLSLLPAGERREWEQSWREAIAKNNDLLADALEEMLNGPFDNEPILLIVDDLERILEEPDPEKPLTPVRDAAGNPEAWRQVLGAVLKAFEAAETESKLLLTSRYLFTLPDGRGRDLADIPAPVQLRPMTAREQAKQWQAALQMENSREKELDDDEATLAAMILQAAGGNPGLQEILCRPILAGEKETAHKALEAVITWKNSGQIPEEESAAQDFFERVSFETYAKALTEAQAIQLRAATLFSEGLPVPVTALEAVGRASSLEDPTAAINRLTGLGLIDIWGETNNVPHAAANPLARPLVKGELGEKERKQLAAAAFHPLVEAWKDSEGDFPIDPRSIELCTVMLLGDAPVEFLEKAAYSAARYLFRKEHNAKAALFFLKSALERIDANGKQPGPGFLLLAANCADRIGERELFVDLLERGVSLEAGDKITLAPILVTYAAEVIAIEDPEKAIETLKTAADLFEQEKDARSRAVTLGKIADILTQRGQTEEALRIRREEQMPVYERLGDVRERAVTLGKIADILTQRGQTEEALRIFEDELLPFFERLGDVHSRAVTLGKIADILTQRGQTEEALRIRREEQMPVYERLGDVRERAVTLGKIADILTQRGQTEEALRIRREEQMPVYERLGDVRERAVTLGKIADILTQRGQTEEALRIRKEEQMPVYERLGDVRERAVTLGKIADILTQRGQTEEALRIRREEQMPVYERLGDVRERAVTLGKIADILTQRGQTEEALRIRREEEMPVYERLGDVRSRAVTLGKIADILTQRGQTEEALRTFEDELLPFFERLGDVRSRAVTLGKIADILTQRGQTEEALRIRREEEMPVYERLGDVHSRAVTLGKIADILTQHGQTEEALRILKMNYCLFSSGLATCASVP